VPDELDVNEVITRGMLNDALAIWSGAIVAQLKKFLGDELTAVETRLYGRLSSRLSSELAAVETRLYDRLSSDLRQHAKAHHEALRALIGPLDDKYKDLPRRVGKLEAAVFAPKRRRR
jgi:hypothetical protein